MEKITNPTSENDEKNTPNFHEVSEKRKELRKAVKELGGKGAIFEKHYKKPLDNIESQASKFKVADFGGLKDAKDALKKQKAKYEEDKTENRAQIDYETILQATPEIDEVKKIMGNIADLKDFRMRRMFETLSPETTPDAKKRNEDVLKTVKEEIKASEEKLGQADPLVLRQAELIKYKEDLAKSGHICITLNVEKDLDAIGDRMLTGKPMFLHGPTGTGKTSLARFAASHFTGKEPEMVYCNPQTKESNVWGKTGIKPTKGGAIETVEIFGPLAKAMREGRAIIFDEFTALPKEQMVFIKGVFNAKVGDRINIVGNGIVEVAPGFQMIFTANLKSEKNPERQDLPPEITREFEQNNLEVKYTQPDEAYDIMLSRLMNQDGSIDMSFYDLNVTLPNLCKVMAEIQESYTNETDKEAARRAGAMDASGKVYSLKKFVMTQGSVEAILSSWLIEKQTGKKERTFAEFLDERFKTALTFKEYPKEDRILVAKILASKGFLLTLSAKDLDLPEDIFKLNTIKAMRGEDAIEELRKESGAVKHLTLKEVAELDPFGKRAELLKNKAEALLGDEVRGKDLFLDDLKRKMRKIFGKEGQPEGLELDHAREIMEKTEKGRFFGPDEIELAFGQSIEDIPPIPFTEEELELGRDNNQFLILRLDKLSDGTPLSMEQMNTLLKGKLKVGPKYKALFNTDWYSKEDFYRKDTPKLSWALVTRETIPNTKSKNYLEQTEELLKYARTIAIDNTAFQEALDEAEAEFNQIKPQITSLINSTPQKASDLLAHLKITKLLRPTPSEVLYDILIRLQNNTQDVMTKGEYIWTSGRSSDGYFAYVGFAGSRGLFVHGNQLDYRHDYLGACLSRSV